MEGLTPIAMRVSLWALLAATSAIALFWLMLVLMSGFEVWRESNSVGLSLQITLLLFPVALFVGLKKAARSFAGTAAIFLAGWIVAAAAVGLVSS